MTRENAKKLLPIIQAYAEGKQVQQAICGKWADLHDPVFDDKAHYYRIKPEPREFWILVRGDQSIEVTSR